MVYNSKTFQLYHELTEAGKAEWQALLEEEADNILLKHQHPLLWLFNSLKGLLGND